MEEYCDLCGCELYLGEEFAAVCPCCDGFPEPTAEVEAVWDEVYDISEYWPV